MHSYMQYFQTNYAAFFLVNKVSWKACAISYLPVQDKWLGSEHRGEFSAYMEPKTEKLSNKFNRNKVMLQSY